MPLKISYYPNEKQEISEILNNFQISKLYTFLKNKIAII